MSLDTRARSAARSLRSAAAHDVDAPVALDRLGRDLRRARLVEVLAAVTLVVVVGAVGWAVASIDSTPAVLPGGADERPVVDVVLADCSADLLDPCLATSGVTYRFPLQQEPVTASVPDGWRIYAVNGSTHTGWGGVDVDLVSRSGYGVSVALDPVAARPVEGKREALRAPRTAPGLAQWLADRPYLAPTKVVTGSLGGWPAHTVDVRLTPGVQGDVRCQPNVARCVPLVLLPFGDEGIGLTQGSVGRMTFVETGNRLVLVFQWGPRGSDLSVLVGTLQPVVDSLRFESAGAGR